MRSFLLLILSATALSAAPVTRDLGQGLVYFRAHHLPADLPADAALKRRPCVLDLRYVAADAAGAQAFDHWLRSHAAPKTPVMVIANQDTSPLLLKPYASATAVPGLIVIGPAAANLATDIAVNVTPRRERRAYDALETGESVEQLIDDNPPKARNDEARLARDHLSDTEMAAENPPPTPDAPPPHPVDPELQRAVQLHRALLALKRL